MKRALIGSTAIMAAMAILTMPGGAAPEDPAADDAAPDFSLPDIDGKVHNMADYKGKIVVLEWTNYDCPFVKKHYKGNMQELQKRYTSKGVIWLTISSSAPGKQGNYPPEKWRSMVKETGAAATALLLDPDGKVGRLYGAKATPHMYVISAEGNIIYQGAIDDKPSWKEEDSEGAMNYVAEAIDSTLAGKPVAVPTTKAYGCSVKY